jgi:predicted DNA-binding transcriptional regulator YafY
MLETSARLLRLLSVLQSRRYWAGAELAGRLEVTDRTLRRDVDRLRSLGYAVEATSGPGGGYRLGNGTMLPPIALDDDEAAAIVVALRTAADSFADLSDTAMRALAKLDPLLPPRIRRRVGALDAATLSIGTPHDRVDTTLLTTFAAACRDRERVRFAYRSRVGEASTRTIEPLKLAHTGNRRWYLVAWDLDRADWRTFRVDRVAEILDVGPRFVPREPPDDLAKYVSDSITHFPYKHRARVKLRGSVESLAESVPPWCGVLEPYDDEHSVLVTGADTPDALVCQVLLARADFELIDSPELVAPMRAIARRLARASVAPTRRRSPTQRARKRRKAT